MTVQVDSEYVLYRTPRGRQNETRRGCCDSCGNAIRGYDPTIQGADPEALGHEADLELIPRLCTRCSVAGLMRPSY